MKDTKITKWGALWLAVWGLPGAVSVQEPERGKKTASYRGPLKLDGVES